MKIIKVIIAALILIMAGYGLLNPSVNITTIMLCLLGILFIIMGREELKKGKNLVGYLLFGVAVFNFYVFIQYLVF